MSLLNRRQFVAVSSALAGLAVTGQLSAAGSPAPVSLGIGNYGMKPLSAEEAVRSVAGIGYDGIEFSLIDGWPTAAKALSPAQRKDLRNRLQDSKLALPSLLESLALKDTAETKATNLERLKLAAALAHDLAPGNPPVIETILGLKTAEWDQAKGRMAGELKEWAKVAEAGNVTICFKPHAAHAVNGPDRALWLLKEVGSPRLRLVYDYSHMHVEGFAMEPSLKQLLPQASFIHVKDSVGTSGKHEYLLPGDGDTDYIAYFKLLGQMNFRGFIIVEVSSMIHRKPDYQALPVAKLCYDRMSKALAQAGLRKS